MGNVVNRFAEFGPFQFDNDLILLQKKKKTFRGWVVGINCLPSNLMCEFFRQCFTSDRLFIPKTK